MYDYREFMVILTSKNVTLRYKQAYIGFARAVLKPLMLAAIFILLRSFADIDSGDIPYLLLTLTSSSVKTA